MIINYNGRNGIWVRMIVFYDLLLILNEYFAIFYVVFMLTFAGWWLLEGFIIGYAFNVFANMLFNRFVVRKNNLEIQSEVITLQPLIYKTIMITIYRYIGLFYNLCVYVPTHRTGKVIKEQLKNDQFVRAVDNMYNVDIEDMAQNDSDAETESDESNYSSDSDSDYSDSQADVDV